MQVLPTKALIPCCKESHIFQKIVPSLNGTQTEGPGTNWLQGGAMWEYWEDGDLGRSGVLRWDRFYSYCFLIGASTMWVLWGQHPGFCISIMHTHTSHIYNIHVVEWIPLSSHYQNLSLYPTLSCLPLCSTENHPSLLLFDTLLNFPASPFTCFIATSSIFLSPSPHPLVAISCGSVPSHLLYILWLAGCLLNHLGASSPCPPTSVP